jgi:hypothetical protein
MQRTILPGSMRFTNRLSEPFLILSTPWRQRWHYSWVTGDEDEVCSFCRLHQQAEEFELENRYDIWCVNISSTGSEGIN